MLHSSCKEGNHRSRRKKSTIWCHGKPRHLKHTRNTGYNAYSNTDISTGPDEERPDVEENGSRLTAGYSGGSKVKRKGCQKGVITETINLNETKFPKDKVKRYSGMVKGQKIKTRHLTLCRKLIT